MKQLDIGLLVLRLTSGGIMLFAHGWGKLTGFSTIVTKFPDPIGLGSSVALALTVFSEVFCAAAIMLGILTRFAAFPLFITMIVAGFVIHANDPFVNKEKAILFAAMYLTLVLTDGGGLSLDRFFRKK